MARISGRIAATASKLASSQDRRGETSGCPDAEREAIIAALQAIRRNLTGA